MQGATSEAPGEAGLVPAPKAGDQDKVLHGDGTWREIQTGSNSNIYEVELEENETHEAGIERIVGETTLNKGDIVIVKAHIYQDKYEYTSYVYNGSNWRAMDGNYNAENIYFDENFIFTENIGTVVVPSTGNIEVEAAGMNLKSFLASIFAKEQNPEEITQPSVSLTASNNKSYEVGTEVTPTYSATFDDGSYQYGPDPTGATVNIWLIIDTDGNSSAESGGSFPKFTVEDTTNYTITAKATHTDGSYPKTNIGNDYTEGQIKGGTKSATSEAITGYRKTFYGTLTTKSDLSSDIIRGLAKSSTYALSNGKTFSITVPVGAMRVVFAYPDTLRDVTSVIDVNGMNAEIVSSFIKTTQDVEGVNDYTAIGYKVFYLDYAEANDKENTYTVKI